MATSVLYLTRTAVEVAGHKLVAIGDSRVLREALDVLADGSDADPQAAGDPLGRLSVENAIENLP